MNHLRTFRYGGIDLEEARSWPVASPIPNAFLPTQALVLLRQHNGLPARCLVSKGDFVREGALIGKANGSGSASIHAPVPGVVLDVRKLRVASGAPCEAVEIGLQGSFDRTGKREEKYIWTSMSRADMIQSLRDRGVVEMEAAGRPIAELVASFNSSITLVLNCVESEPYLRTERTVLKERGPEVLGGLAIMRRLIDPGRTIVAFESSDPDDEAANTLKTAVGEIVPPVEALLLRSRYPQELPNQIASVVAPGRTTQDPASFYILSPSTALAIYEALAFAKPVIERYVTVAGAAIKYPAVLKVRIGTPIGDLVEECGGFLGQPERLVMGGPLRGDPVCNLDAPITKQTKAVLALTHEETNSGSPHACIRCGRCRDACPERLFPAELFRRIQCGHAADAWAFGLEACSFCGACGFICPSRLPLVETFATAVAMKGALR
jgi:electron transport complex protein RnfC